MILVTSNCAVKASRTGDFLAQRDVAAMEDEDDAVEIDWTFSKRLSTCEKLKLSQRYRPCSSVGFFPMSSPPKNSSKRSA